MPCIGDVRTGYGKSSFLINIDGTGSAGVMAGLGVLEFPEFSENVETMDWTQIDTVGTKTIRKNIGLEFGNLTFKFDNDNPAHVFLREQKGTLGEALNCVYFEYINFQEDSKYSGNATIVDVETGQDSEMSISLKINGILNREPYVAPTE